MFSAAYVVVYLVIGSLVLTYASSKRNVDVTWWEPIFIFWLWPIVLLMNVFWEAKSIYRLWRNQ